MRARSLGGLAASLALVLSACGSTQFVREHSVAAPRLGDAVLAVAIGPQLMDLGDDDSVGGYLALVGRRGDVRLIRVSAMDAAVPLWTSAGLFFSDEDRDYVLTERLRSARSPKGSGQQQLSMVPTGGGRIALGVYNYGGGGRHYYSEIVRTGADGQVERRLVEGFYGMVADCDGVLYGVAPADEEALRGPFPGAVVNAPVARFVDADSHKIVLAQLTGTRDGKARVVATDVNDTGPDLENGQPCRHGVFTALDAVALPHRPTGALAVLTWNVRTGRSHRVPFFDAQGRPVSGASDGQDSASIYGGPAIRAGDYEWVRSNGQVMASDLKTGLTRVRFDTGCDDLDGNAMRVAFTERSIYALCDGLGDMGTARPMRLLRFDRASGTKISELRVDGLNQVLRGPQMIHGIAVRPHEE